MCCGWRDSWKGGSQDAGGNMNLPSDTAALVERIRTLEIAVADLGERIGRPSPGHSAPSHPRAAGFREESLLGLLAVGLGAFAIALDLDRGGYVLYLGSIPVRCIQLGVAMVLLGADFFARRSGIVARLGTVISAPRRQSADASGRPATPPCR